MTTKPLVLNAIRQSQIRSFQRLEHAVEQLVEAVRSGAHRVTPEMV